MGTMLAAMNISNWECVLHYYMNENKTVDAYECPYIQFATNFIVELFYDPSLDEWLVRHTVNDKYYDQCYGQFISDDPKDEYMCRYKYYTDHLKSSIGDYQEFCFADQPSDGGSSSFTTRNVILGVEAVVCL